MRKKRILLFLFSFVLFLIPFRVKTVFSQSCQCVLNPITMLCEEANPGGCGQGAICECFPIYDDEGNLAGCGGSCLGPTSTPTPFPTSPPSLPPPSPGPEQPDQTFTIYTAIGPIDVSSFENFIGVILNFAIGIGGGVAIILIIIGGVKILTSAGNPQKVQAGKELITSAITGLLFIIFSVFILRIIGVEILKIF